ncbi:unique cartilage matrix-associated protein isoform X2 [Corythoichthys intestinalis]|uniref:unique cartilage matrix-associated protein isoform X2 n=1 Tax=Corythoichthys intestinalis TaxID=161448 RepID=UPI0025A53499|nr:unique cartilage matrix-associated protein isoform X2 [Corythoichthys intestinalis]
MLTCSAPQSVLSSVCNLGEEVKMSWNCGTFLVLLTALVVISLSPEADCAAVPNNSQTAAKEPQAEQRQVLAADERRREFHEEKRNEFESYVEEVDDEQNERSRESTEQWREFHYDGMHPAYEYNRQTI